MKPNLITLLEQNLPNVPFLVLNEDVLQSLLEPENYYPARAVHAVAKLLIGHTSRFAGPVYTHVFGNELLISMNREAFRRQSQIMLLTHG